MQDKKITIAPFTPEHFHALALREEDRADFAGIDETELFAVWADGATYLRDGQPFLIYGGTLLDGVATVWLVGSAACDSLPLFICKEARRRITWLFEEGGVHRVESYCHRNNTRSLYWLIRQVGFKVEGLMRKSGPNKQDRYLLAMTDDDFKGGAIWAG